MSRIKSTNTRVEKDFFRILAPFRRDGYKHRKHYTKLIGKPDVVFLDQKIAIFVDGDFWHGYQFKKLSQRLPKKYWIAKIEKNKKRDRVVNQALKKDGWRVLRFWEHEVKRSPSKVSERLLEYLVE